jgi:hypothetical protein
MRLSKERSRRAPVFPPDPTLRHPSHETTAGRQGYVEQARLTARNASPSDAGGSASTPLTVSPMLLCEVAMRRFATKHVPREVP